MIRYFYLFLLHLTENSCILYSFNNLNNEKVYKEKFLFAVCGVSILQVFIGQFNIPIYMMFFIELSILFLFLMLYSMRWNVTCLIHSFLIVALFQYSTLMIHTMKAWFPFEIQGEVYQTIEIIVSKLCLVLLVMIWSFYVKKLRESLNEKVYHIIFFIISCFMIMDSYIILLSEEYQSFSGILTLEFCAIFMAGVFFYGKFLEKKKMESAMFFKMIELSEENIDLIAKNQKLMQTQVHDMKNKLLDTYELLDQGKNEQVRQYVANWLIELVYATSTPLCLNVYVDHIIRKKWKNILL